MASKILPILVSVPHAGTKVPEMVKALNLLTKKQMISDGDEGAAEIYDFQEQVKSFITTDIARAFVDLNRHPEDRDRDGVVKTHTCQLEPIYKKPLGHQQVRILLKQYYYPYHGTLEQLSRSDLLFGLDCHTMAETAPKISPDHGKKRPRVCLSNAGTGCPEHWLDILGEGFENHFGAGSVGINQPFKGGYIIRKHSKYLNWIQLEISREGFADNKEKKEVVLDVIGRFVEKIITNDKLL